MAPTTQRQQISEADAKILQGFEDLIKYGDAPYLRKALTNVYITYTRLLLKSPDLVNVDNDNELYYLSALIEVFEAKKT